jgi:hypothetical protein
VTCARVQTPTSHVDISTCPLRDIRVRPTRLRSRAVDIGCRPARRPITVVPLKGSQISARRRSSPGVLIPPAAITEKIKSVIRRRRHRRRRPGHRPRRRRRRGGGRGGGRGGREGHGMAGCVAGAERAGVVPAQVGRGAAGLPGLHPVRAAPAPRDALSLSLSLAHTRARIHAHARARTHTHRQRRERGARARAPTYTHRDTCTHAERP